MLDGMYLFSTLFSAFDARPPASPVNKLFQVVVRNVEGTPLHVQPDSCCF